jgi:hypothetical protein
VTCDGVGDDRYAVHIARTQVDQAASSCCCAECEDWRVGWTQIAGRLRPARTLADTVIVDVSRECERRGEDCPSDASSDRLRRCAPCGGSLSVLFVAIDKELECPQGWLDPHSVHTGLSRDATCLRLSCGGLAGHSELGEAGELPMLLSRPSLRTPPAGAQAPWSVCVPSTIESAPYPSRTFTPAVVASIVASSGTEHCSNSSLSWPRICNACSSTSRVCASSWCR